MACHCARFGQRFFTMSTEAPTPHHLSTPWTGKVSKTLPHPEYPRPQFVRSEWVNLNGTWEFSQCRESRLSAVIFDQKILVPFPVESALSGVTSHVTEEDHLWYRRTFNRPAGERVLLHFGAVDFSTTVFVNGVEVGHHKGGFDPFSFDITEALISQADQELVVYATDPVDAGAQPRGKQVRSPEGIFYTSTSGIWQTVWLEPVPAISIEKAVIHADPNTGEILVNFSVRGSGVETKFEVQVLNGDVVLATAQSDSATVSVKITDPKVWSPESPFLYDLKLKLLDESGAHLDTVESYTAFREIKIATDSQGIRRIFLNGEPCFMFGPLDQGFWPDGLFTPPTDEALKYDIEVTKRLGFNMIRKHVKVEPDRWYTWCDRLGILVWQDMPSGDKSIRPEEPDIERTPESAAQFELELKAMMDALRNHPSIVCWIPFNEGWGQFDTARITDLTRAYDPTRILDSTTGWSDRGVGDMMDIHDYPGPSSPQPEEHRVAVLGEFGGLGLPVPGHMWQAENWGYQSYKTEAELTQAVIDMFAKLAKLVDEPGLAAAVYTQTTDVETEANGLMTYDRAVLKMDEAKLREAILAVYGSHK